MRTVLEELEANGQVTSAEPDNAADASRSILPTCEWVLITKYQNFSEQEIRILPRPNAGEASAMKERQLEVVVAISTLDPATYHQHDDQGNLC